jgi:GAF domain-containing protein
MHELFGEEGRFAGHGVPVLAAAVAPIFVRGEYVGGLLAIKSLSYEPLDEADTSLLGEVAKLCGTSHARAIEFRRAWDSNTALNELLAAYVDDVAALQRIFRTDDLLIVDRPHALMAPDRTILASSSAFDEVLAASHVEEEAVGALDRIVGDSRVSEVAQGVRRASMLHH